VRQRGRTEAKEKVHILPPFCTSCGQITLLAVGRSVSEQVVSARVPYIFRTPFVLHYLLLEKSERESRRKKKKRRKKERKKERK
jgi:hypothetical protein